MFLRSLLTFGLCVLLLAAPVLAADPPGAAGYWEGEIKVPSAPLKIQLTLEQQGAAPLGGAIDIPVQAIRNLKLIDVAIENNKVSFGLPDIPGAPKFHGTLAADGNTLSGQFSQGGQTFPFELTRKQAKPQRRGATPEKGIPGDGLEGIWQGTLRIPPVELRLVFNFAAGEDGSLAGTLKSIDQTPDPIPLSAVTTSDRQVELEVATINGAFKGELNDDQSEIAGTWSQAGTSFPLVVKRVSEEPEVRRPQEPKPPFPYDVDDVTFENAAAKITLAGTLTKPKSAGPHPAVVMITGSGPQNRDEQLLGHKPFAVIADHLTRKGIAVLRFDDRGIGKSTGDFGAATHYDFVGDALAGLDWLKTRPEINADQIGLVGHSEGGVVAPLAAVERPDDVGFIVMLAGVGVPMQQLLKQQGKDIGKAMGLPMDMLSGNAEIEQEYFRILGPEGDELDSDERRQQLKAVVDKSMAEFTQEQRDKLGITPELLDARIKMMLTPWYRQLSRYNPRPTLEKVRCPVLAINGEKDLQVAADDNLEAIRAALEAGGNADIKVVKLAGLNHLFQECTTGSLAEYAVIEQTFAPVALDAISDWILEHVEVQQGGI